MSKHGYSGTPMAQKLGYKDGFKVLIHDAPDNYKESLSLGDRKVTFIDNPSEQHTIDLLHLFCHERSVLLRYYAEYLPLLKKTGMMWISWPKKSSKIRTDLSRDIIREMILERGLVDVKIAAYNDSYSCLKFVYRVKDR